MRAYGMSMSMYQIRLPHVTLCYLCYLDQSRGPPVIGRYIAVKSSLSLKGESLLPDVTHKPLRVRGLLTLAHNRNTDFGIGYVVCA